MLGPETKETRIYALIKSEKSSNRANRPRNDIFIHKIPNQKSQSIYREYE